MRLSPGKFNAFLHHIGQRFDWQRSYDCPCRDPHSGAALFSCAQCHGMGQIWATVAVGEAAPAGQKVQRAWADFGMWENGDVVITIPSNSPLYGMGEFDRVVMTDSSQPFSTFRTRGAVDDKLLLPVTQIDRVFWLDDNEAIVEGGIPAVAADGTLTWTSGEPPAGEQYSITGRHHPEYFCWGDFPSDRAHHQGAALPRKVVLRKFDLFGRG